MWCRFHFVVGESLLAAALVSGVACQRTEEPAPAPVIASEPAASTSPAPAPTATTSASAARRCILETPKTPPPIASASASAAACPADPETPPRLAVASVSFPAAKDATLQVEIARSEAESARGLMYRRTMPADHGMLFRMAERREHTFWMRNTCISLDMVFIDDDGTIVGILENVPTLNDAERTVGCPSSWVLETNAGWTRRHGIVAGQRVTIPPSARGG